jgi:hypothetical protein
MLHWEDVPSDGRMTVSRAKVPGGWLVFTRWGSNLAGMTFYPEPNHQWDRAGTDPLPDPEKTRREP